MKYFLLLLLVISCSPNNPNKKPTISKIQEEIVSFEPLNISTIEESSVVTIPSSSLDFSSIQPNQTVIQDLIITNKQLTNFEITASDIVSNDISPFLINENTCSDKNLERNRSCKLSFSIKNNPNPSEILLTKSLTIKGVVISLSATLIADTTNTNLPISGLTVSPVSLDFGLMKDGESKDLGIIVSNRTLSSQVISNPIITSPKLSITSNTCSSLPRNRSCTIKIRYSASSDDIVLSAPFTTINNTTIQHSVVVQSPTILSPSVLNISPITATANINLTEPQIQAGTVSFKNNDINGLSFPVGVEVSPNDGVVSISSVSCSGGFARNRTCLVSYSANSVIAPEGLSQYVLKLKAGSLSSGNYIINLNTVKTSPVCDLLNAQGNGVTSITNVLSVSGNLPNCSVSSCSDNYKPALDNKSCIAKNCNELNAGELATLGFNTLGATISGIYPTCSLTCNSSFQELAGDAKSCVDKIPNGTISFSQDYTKELTGNLLNISQINAQQIQFYSDSSCSSPIGSLIYLPLTQTSISLSSGDGLKSSYAKLINGSANSSCLSDSITLDQTAPVFIGGLIYPTQTEDIDKSISIESIIISDSSPTTLEFSLGTGLSYDNVLGFSNIIPVTSTFQATVLNGYLPSGFNFSSLIDYNIGLRITDSAGNQSSVQVAGPFQYIIPSAGVPIPTFGNTISGDQYSTDGVRSFHNQLNITNEYGATSALANASVEAINAMAVQSDGKIILAGKTDRTLSTPNTDIAVWRANQDGSLDSTFSGDGFFTRPGTESQIGGADIGAEEVFDVKVRPNGKILLVGAGARNTSGAIYTSCVIWQLNSDGTLDSSFGGTSYFFQAPSTATTSSITPGIIVIAGAGGYPSTTATGVVGGSAGAGGSDICRSVELLNDSSFIVGGSTKGYHNLDFMMAKFSESGILDSSFVGGTVFNTTGTRVSSTRPGFFLFSGLSGSNVTSINDQLFELFIKDNNIYAVGQIYTPSPASFDIAVVKLSAISGAIDTTFSSTGSAGAGVYIHSVASSTDIGQDVLVLDNNKILITGAIGGADNLASSRNMAVIRLNSNGTIDTSFGSSGVFTHAGASTNGAVNKEDMGMSIKLLPSGKIMVGGHSNKSDGTTNTGLPNSGNNNFDLVLWKLNSNGTLDTSFNSVGYLSKGISENYANANSADWSNVSFGADFLNDIVIIDNKIFAAGSVYYGRNFVNTDGILWRVD